MSESDLHTAEPKHDPYAALRQRNFQFYSLSRIFSTLGNQMFQAILAWQIYKLTGTPLSLGFLGLSRFLPALSMSMIGGTIADTYDRRKIMQMAQCVPVTCAILLAFATYNGWVSQFMIYGLAIFIGMASAFEAPARTAFLPSIVKPETFGNAVTVNNIFQKLGSVTGPTLAGFIIGTFSITTAYGVYVSSMAVAITTLFFIHSRRTESRSRRISFKVMREGVSYVVGHQVLLGAMSLDLFAVVFGGAAALLPVYATKILHGGPQTFGFLSASIEVGAFAMSFVLVAFPPIRRTGRALVYTVIAYGLATMAFGLSRNLYLSLLFYGLIGASDQISVVMRQTTIQLATPDELRGRVSSVQQVFTQGSTQIGAIESGFVAALMGATFAVVSGGAAAIAVACFVGWRLPLLYGHEVTNRSSAAVNPLPSNAPQPAAPEPSAAGGGS